YPFDEKAFAEKLVDDIKNNRYEPSPNNAFVIRQKNKKDRVVEQMNFKDLIVSRYLVKTVYKIFDTIFEEASIGSRKGISRERAVELVKTALAEGYEYMIESDIEEFFPSVDLQVLHRLLDSILPTGDTMIKHLLEKLTGNGYLLEGRFHERLKGLALGNPLSSCLANLYLDSFDEYIRSMDVRVIRYEDEVMIFCKNLEDAEVIALKLDIDSLNIGLEQKVFGSIFFQKGGNLFKKESLCIDEVGVFLGLMGNMIFVKKGQEIINVMPLRKIEDIEIRGDSIVSAALLRRCKEWNISLVIRLINGYVLPVLVKVTNNKGL
ncbi:MAG TPA: reverse transcriptase domain-containing protein, partial [Candidatus Kapabacteria bacterium]|nr:reverse transcriptase domain-containing protein [Candidatus Kapabacteria bacterium]